MDRFCWTDGLLGPDEHLLIQQSGVKLYDGEEKTAFIHGKILLTTHRVIWRDYKDQKSVISMPLSYIIFSEEHSAGWSSSAKVVCHLNAVSGYRPPGPATSSKHSVVRFSFKDGGHSTFLSHLNEAVAKKAWTQEGAAAASTSSAKGPKKVRTGIGGIEKTLAQKNRDTDKNISVAFEDLSKLMEKAKDMVGLAKNISTKIKDKHGDITEDETVKFKSYLLSLGVADPVTRDTHGSGDKYYRELAKQVATMLEGPLKEFGGVMTMTDVYCRVNRARGMELLSPEDLINACKLLEQLALPVRMRVFESGVIVLQLASHSESKLIAQTTDTVTDKGSATADELSRWEGVSVVLAKERLLSSERAGKLCRDEDVEGLRFYPNLFLSEGVS